MRIAALGLATFLLAGCWGSGTGPTIATVGTPSSTGQAATGIDTKRVAALLGEAVGTVIVVTNRNCSGTSDCLIEGSAFVIAHENGISYMLTNNHVIQGARLIQIMMPSGRHYVATVKDADARTDLAILQVPDPALKAVVFGDSTTVQVGQPVLAIGSPLQQLGAVSMGIVSSLHRSITAQDGTSSEELPDMIETDAAIRAGNSGGPLADADGHVIGVNTAAGISDSNTDRNGSNFGYAIPSVVAKRIAEALMAGRPPGHPYLGLQFVEEADALAVNSQDYPVDGHGALVTGVCVGQPGDRSGIKPRDVILNADGVDLNNGQTLNGIIQRHDPGYRLPLTLLRSGSTIQVQVTLAQAPASTRC